MSISLTEPFTRATLSIIRKRLAKSPIHGPSTSSTGQSQQILNAGVLIPLCNVEGVPSILFEVRSQKLRTHSGEVSFPGGRVEPTDETFLAAALRETHEEIGVFPSQVEYLGTLKAAEISLNGKLRVWPYIGFIHSSVSPVPSPDLNDTTALPSISLPDLRSKLSPVEVAQIFHLPLQELVSPTRMRSSFFRGEAMKQYFTVDVSDIAGVPAPVLPDGQVQIDEVGPGVDGKVEVWGLTGWYLNLFLRALQVPSWALQQ